MGFGGQASDHRQLKQGAIALGVFLAVAAILFVLMQWFVGWREGQCMARCAQSGFKSYVYEPFRGPGRSLHGDKCTCAN
jgi:hypothetical protein